MSKEFISKIGHCPYYPEHTNIKDITPDDEEDNPVWKCWVCGYEWDALEERMNITPENLEELDNVILELPTIEYEGDILTLYTFEDFSLMHNQGIFRDTKFLIDKKGKWTKNIVTEMTTYGYEHIKPIIISTAKYLIMREING